MLIDWLPTVQLKLIMGLDIPDCPPKCPTPGMAVIRVIDMMFMIDQTNVLVGKLYIVDVPNMPGVIADQSHIIRICHNHREIFPVDCLKLFRGKHAAPGSATICVCILTFSAS